MDYQEESNLKIGVSGAGKNYLKMPWSIEDTIENLEELKEMMQQKLIMTNYHGRGEKDAEEIAFDFDRAIQALKENQEYKKLGTLEEMELLKATHFSGIELAKISCRLKQLEKYVDIGTLEEVREAVEKQREKKATYDGDGYAPDGTFVWEEWICPHCGSRFEVDYDDYDYCPNCGQHIDWSEEE